MQRREVIDEGAKRRVLAFPFDQGLLENEDRALGAPSRPLSAAVSIRREGDPIPDARGERAEGHANDLSSERCHP